MSKPVALMLALTLIAAPLHAQARRNAAAPSELRDSVALFSNDRNALLRRFTVEYSTSQIERMRGFYTDWQARLAARFDRRVWRAASTGLLMTTASAGD